MKTFIIARRSLRPDIEVYERRTAASFHKRNQIALGKRSRPAPIWRFAMISSPDRSTVSLRLKSAMKTKLVTCERKSMA